MYIVWNLISIAVGAAVTWGVSRYYFQRSATKTTDDIVRLIREVRDASDDVRSAIAAYSSAGPILRRGTRRLAP